MTHNPDSPPNATPPPRELTVGQTQFLAESLISTLQQKANNNDPDAKEALRELRAKLCKSAA